MTTSAQMKATLGLDVSQFETRARGAANTAKQMGAEISRALDGSKASARSQAAAFEHLRASIDPAYAATQRYAQLQRQISGYVDAGVTSQRTANMVLEQAASKYMGVATSAERAQAAQREQAQSTMLAKQSYDALRTSLDPLYASSKRYEQAQETLTAAVAAGIIKQEEAARVLQMANQRYLSVGPAANAATSGVNKFTPAITNAGFQVQDFAVQVASGQSAMMAFAQQFPQLMGVLGFSGKLALAGSLIGTFAAVAFAVAPMLFDIGEAAAKTSDTVADLGSALQSYQEYAAKARGTSAELFAEFGMGAARGRELYDALSLLERIKFDQNLSASIKSLTGDLQGVTDMIAQWDYATLELPPALRAETIYLSQEAVQKLGDEYGLTLGQARQVTNALSDLSMAAGPEQAAIAAKNLAQSLLSAHAAGAKLPPELVEAARSAAETGVAAERMNAILNSSVGLGTSLASEFDRLAASIGYAAASAAQLAAQLGAAAVAGAQQADRQLKVINAQIAAVKSGQDEVVAGKLRGLELDKEAFRNAHRTAGVDAGIVETMVRKNFASQEAVVYAERELQSAIKVRTETERAAKAGSGGKSAAAKESEKLSASLDKEAQKWLDTIDPMNRYQREMSELLQLQGRLSKEDMAKAIKKLNVDLADSIPMVGDLSNAFADFVVSGGKDIEGLGDLFKGVLKQMIADAAKNQIMLALGIAPTGTAGTPGAAGGTAGAGGTLSNFGGIFAEDGWLMTGLNSGKGFLGTVGGWLGMGGQAAGTAGTASGIMGSLGSLGSMMGTVGAIIGGIGMVVSLGKKLFGRELKDTGISGAFSGSGFSGSSYKYYKGGLLRSDKTSYEALDPVVQSTIGAAYGDLRKSVKGMAGVLDLGTDAIKGFAYEFKISTKDMTEEEALQALQDEMAKAGSGMAELILGTKRYTEAGETALDTLTRLSSSLTAVRQVALLLGHTFDMVGLRGGDVASNLAKAFGGAESMGTAVQAYWQTFYTDGERIRTLTRQTGQELRKMGVSMPRTREQYRALIESLDLSDKSSHKLYATLIGLSGVMDQILPTVSNLTREMERLQGRVVTIMDKIATGLTAAIQANQAAAGEWRKAGDGIRDYLDKLRGTASALISPMQARAYNQMKWMTTLASARAGDLTAAGNLTGTAGNYLDSVSATAGTRLEAARAQARVAAALGLVANKTETQADKLDRIATIQGRQLALIERLQALMDAGKTISAEQLDLLRTQLGDLDRKILRVNVAGFEGATSLLPKGQMQGLRSALDDLRDAIRAETARQKHESAVTSLNALVGNLTKNKAGDVFVDDKDLSRMARIAGIDAEGLTTNQLRNRLVNFDSGDLLKGTVYDPTGSKEQAYLDRLRGPSNVSGPAPQWAEGLLGFWQRIYNNPNLTVKDIMAASKGGTPLSEIPGALEVETVKKKVKKFADGGYHAGGLRLVGEEGPELEATGPSRIYSASQTRNIFDMTGLMREFRAMREELAQMRREQRQLGLSIEGNTYTTASVLRREERRALSE
ncbi:hypothetical protein GCM10010991_07520 [Gemmobacter aquaticus]|uniref:Prophage tail length tape measure protein n=1 Tax=Gemmobacter aquaticus TaxID=490185 RepID=A0A918DCC3_9RHOB|nr:hypothetical protein [Gemmobacter aquaticus]GGO26652.1 hypothetical protein GCM10010991_07520 [Gemmobacter aquaticus]